MKKIYAGFLAALMVTGLALSGCGNVQIDGADSKNTTSSTSSSEGTQEAAVKSNVKDPYADDVKIAFVPNVIGDSVAAAWGDGMDKELSIFENVTFCIRTSIKPLSFWYIQSSIMFYFRFFFIFVTYITSLCVSVSSFS